MLYFMRKSILFCDPTTLRRKRFVYQVSISSSFQKLLVASSVSPLSNNWANWPFLPTIVILPLTTITKPFWLARTSERQELFLQSQIRLPKFNSTPPDIWRLWNISEQIASLFDHSHTEFYANDIHGCDDLQGIYAGVSDHLAVAKMYYKFKELNVFSYLHMASHIFYKLPVLFKPTQLFYPAI